MSPRFAVHTNLMFFLTEGAGSAESGADTVFTETAFRNSVPLTKLSTDGSMDAA